MPYLASGTDQQPMIEEAELLGRTRYFQANIFGALDDYKILIERLIRESSFARSREFLAFGDGYVEVGNVTNIGGMSVASDEPACREVNQAKRERLIGVSADWIVPDYSAQNALLGALFPS